MKLQPAAAKLSNSKPSTTVVFAPEGPHQPIAFNLLVTAFNPESNSRKGRVSSSPQAFIHCLTTAEHLPRISEEKSVLQNGKLLQLFWRPFRQEAKDATEVTCSLCALQSYRLH